MPAVSGFAGTEAGATQDPSSSASAARRPVATLVRASSAVRLPSSVFLAVAAARARIQLLGSTVSGQGKDAHN